MTQDSSKVPPESYFEEQAALQLLVPRAKLLAALADAYGAEPAAPVLFVSPLQLAAHRDHEGAENAEGGRYLPARKTPAGKFTQPLYALPPAAPAKTDALGAPGEVVKAIREYLGVHPDLVLGGQVLDSMALELSRIALDYPADLIGALALEELMQLGYTVEAGAILPPRDLPEQACEFFGVRPVAGPSAGMTWWNNASEAERARWSAAAGNTGVPADAYAAFLRHTAAPQAPAAPSAGNWIPADDVARLVRDLDVALSGEADAAPQASLCDIVGMVKKAARELGRPVLAAPAVDARESVARAIWAVMREYEDRCDMSLEDMGEHCHAWALADAAIAARAPAVDAPWKDHQTARLVNDLRDCAKTYHAAGQLRDRIAFIVAPLCDQLKAAQAAPAVDAVRLAVRDYHHALDTRQHGGVAASTAIDAIQAALGMEWTQGAEATARAAQAKEAGGAA